MTKTTLGKDALDRLNSVCFLLIHTCSEANAETMTIKQDGVTHHGKPLGDWEVVIRKVS